MRKDVHGIRKNHKRRGVSCGRRTKKRQWNMKAEVEVCSWWEGTNKWKTLGSEGIQ